MHIRKYEEAFAALDPGDRANKRTPRFQIKAREMVTGWINKYIGALYTQCFEMEKFD